MTWTKLLATKDAQKHKTSKKELDNMRALIARYLADRAFAAFRQTRVSQLLTMLHSKPQTWPSRVQGIEFQGKLDFNRSLSLPKQRHSNARPLQSRKQNVG